MANNAGLSTNSFSEVETFQKHPFDGDEAVSDHESTDSNWKTEAA